MIKVLIVEDSAVVRQLLVALLSADPEIQVVGTASNGVEALEAVRRTQPTVITMDSHMPKMNGYEATRQIMETYPTPIVMVSGSWGAQEVATTFRAVEAGALAVMPQPPGPEHPAHEAMVQDLIQTVKLMAEVKVVRRWARRQRTTAPATSSPERLADQPKITSIQIVAVGASTGGPVVLQTLLSKLPKDLPIPVVMVQHMAAGFIPGFADWLSLASGWPVHVATDGELLLPGHAYIAPDGFQMKVQIGGKIVLCQDESENGLRPSISYLFRSVAEVYGANAAGILLTGMGKDGAQELKLLRDKGAVTFAQDEESSIVYGMPREAVRLNAATYVLSPENIASVLTEIVHERL
jgi:two-component system chemotaxis response regulator CheB